MNDGVGGMSGVRHWRALLPRMALAPPRHVAIIAAMLSAALPKLAGAAPFAQHATAHAAARPTCAVSPTSLVLLVGAGARPDSAVIDDFARAGLRCLWLADAEQAVSASAHARFDGVVLHLTQPVALAARHFERWRAALRCPLLVLTDRSDEVDEIMALELGADACLALPLSPRRLRAQLLALLRRAAPQASSLLPQPAKPTATDVSAGDAERPVVAAAPSLAGWTLDRIHNRLSNAQRGVELSGVLASLLHALMADHGCVVPRSRLLDQLPNGHERNVRSVDRYVARLRQRLRQAQVEGLRIEVVRDRGYMLRVMAPERAEMPSSLLRLLPERRAQAAVAAV